MTGPLVTTLIPTFRRPHLLKKAIESVLNQTVKECIAAVFDNASGDETTSVVGELQKKDSRVLYFCHKENIGLEGNFAFALNHVSTPYFSFLSDDDLLLPWFYETALQGFEKHPECGLSICRTLSILPSKKLIPFQFLNPYFEGVFSSDKRILQFIEKGCELWTSMLFRSDLLPKVGGLSNNVGFAFDVDLTLRYAAHAPYFWTQKPCALFLHWKKSRSSVFITPPWPSFKQVIHNTLPLVNNQEDVFQKYRETYSIFYRRIWMHLLIQKNLKDVEKFRSFLLKEGEEQEASLFSKALFVRKYFPFARFFLKALLFTRRALRRPFFLFKMKQFLKQEPEVRAFLKKM